ncbi:MAG: hypothetical protein FJ299_04430 [Planctomycetes bacterium]|nr:hypothetical protein [Planctomycetota bacterium]
MPESPLDWLVLLVPGRVLLALLAPGPIGALRPLLPWPSAALRTLVACLALGTALWPAQVMVGYWLGVQPPAHAAAALAWMSPWLVLALVLLTLGPRALVPGGDGREPWTWNAGVDLCLLAAPVALELGLGPEAWALAGLGFAICWRRRADRRALALAALAFGLAAGTRQVEAWIGLGGLAALVLASARPARASAAAHAALAVCLIALPLTWTELDKTGRGLWWGVELNAR